MRPWRPWRPCPCRGTLVDKMTRKAQIREISEQRKSLLKWGDLRGYCPGGIMKRIVSRRHGAEEQPANSRPTAGPRGQIGRCAELRRAEQSGRHAVRPSRPDCGRERRREFFTSLRRGRASSGRGRETVCAYSKGVSTFSPPTKSYLACRSIDAVPPPPRSRKRPRFLSNGWPDQSNAGSWFPTRH